MTSNVNFFHTIRHTHNQMTNRVKCVCFLRKWEYICVYFLFHVRVILLRITSSSTGDNFHWVFHVIFFRCCCFCCCWWAMQRKISTKQNEKNLVSGINVIRRILSHIYYQSFYLIWAYRLCCDIFNLWLRKLVWFFICAVYDLWSMQTHTQPFLWCQCTNMATMFHHIHTASSSISDEDGFHTEINCEEKSFTVSHSLAGMQRCNYNSMLFHIYEKFELYIYSQCM